MRYRVVCISDGHEYTLHDLRDQKRNGEDESGRMMLHDTVVKKSENPVDFFDFKILQNHPNKLRIQNRLSDIIVYEDEFELFCGFPLIDEQDFENTGKVSCEGIASFFNDSVIRPYTYTGSVRGYLEMLVENHNDQVEERKQFKVGNVTVIDSNDNIVRSNEKCTYTLKEMQNKLQESSLGGYLKARRVNGVNYIDYLEIYGSKNGQKIEYGKNLLDLNRKRDDTEIKTALIPFGAEVTEEDGSIRRVTISSVNEGKDYIIDDAAVQQFGYIWGFVYFDDVTEPENLYAKTRNLLNQLVYFTESITASAIDLNITVQDMDKIRFGDTYDVYSSVHNISVEMMMTSCSISLNDISNNMFTFGTERKGGISSIIHEIRKDMEEAALSSGNRIQRAKEQFNEAIQNASGLYCTEEEQEDGSFITYYHNKEKLDDSMIIITFNDAGIAVSNDGGNNWYGLRVDGDFLANIISAYGLQAEWIRGGWLSSLAQDDSGQPISYIDLDTGEIAKFGNIAFVRRESGNQSLKWMGE